MKDTKRAKRRAAEKRIKARIRDYYGGYMRGRDDEARIVGHLLQARTPCSGPCCGNPRHWFGTLTLQERRAKDEMEGELGEISEESLPRNYTTDGYTVWAPCVVCGSKLQVMTYGKAQCPNYPHTDTGD